MALDTDLLREIKDDAIERQKKKERADLKTEKKENDRINALIKLRKGASSQDRKAYITEIQEIKEARKAREEEKTFRQTELGQIKNREDELTAFREKIERQGGVAEKNKEFLKMQADIAKDTFQLQVQQASPSKKKELLKEQAAKDKKQLTILQRVSVGISKIGDSLKERFVKAGGGFLDFLKKGALIGLLFLLPKILNSQFVRDAVKLIEDTIIPALKSFYNNILVPLASVIKDVFIRQFEIIKGFFDDIGVAIQQFKDGDILGGLSTLILGIGTFFAKTIDNLITGVYNLIAKIFGLSETDSVFGSIGKFFTDVYNDVVSFVSEMYTNVTSFISGIFTGIGDFISENFGSVVSYIKDLFTFDSEGFTFAKLIDIAFMGINLAINFIKDIFGFGEEGEPFSLGNFITEKATQAFNYLKSLFDFEMPELSFDFGLDKLLNVFKAVKSGIGAALKALLPGGETPQEAFRRAYSETMESGNESDGGRTFSMQTEPQVTPPPVTAANALPAENPSPIVPIVDNSVRSTTSNTSIQNQSITPHNGMTSAIVAAD